jgi:hypothetical protein
LGLHCFQSIFKVEITRIYIKIINIDPFAFHPFVYVAYSKLKLVIGLADTAGTLKANGMKRR